MQNDNKVLLPHLSQTTENISASATQESGQAAQSFNSDFVAAAADSRATELSGPQFHEKTQEIEKAKNNGWGGKIKDTFKEKRSVIMAFGIILASIVGGVILASALNSGTENLQAGLTAVNTETSTTANSTATTNDNTISATGNAVTGEITQTATYGEGVTHLARKAVAEYLAAGGVELNAEQKIYAEDYLKDLSGTAALEEGDTLTFAATDIKEAVDASLALEEWQLENLTQYTQNAQL